MELIFHNNYAEYSDEDIVKKVITPPYNEEAAAFLIYQRYNPLLKKIYGEVYDKDNSWYEDCQGDLYDYLKGKNLDWQKLRAFQWRSSFSTYLRRISKNRFVEIKPYLIGKIPFSLSIDDDDEHKAPVQIPDNGVEEYEITQKKIILMEAIGMLKDPDQKFVILKRLQGYNSKEIAELMKKSWEKHHIIRMDKGKRVIPSAGYVDVRTQRAKENLKAIIVKLM